MEYKLIQSNFIACQFILYYQSVYCYEFPIAKSDSFPLVFNIPISAHQQWKIERAHQQAQLILPIADPDTMA